jgi:two-component system, NarL family, nitrate/nitrite response regulator NarL
VVQNYKIRIPQKITSRIVKVHQLLRAARIEGPSIGVIIADASRMHCQLMATALRRSRYRIDVVCNVTESQEALKALNEKQPDIAVIGSNLHDGPLTGFKVLRELQASHSKCKTIMLIDSPEREIVVEAFRRGAHGVISRDELFETLCECVRAVDQGQIWVRAEELRFLVDAVVESASPRILNAKGVALLTKQEQGVVRLVAEGLTNRDIGRQMNLSENTVRNYVFRIFDKLGTSNRVELALYAFHQKM